MRTLQVLYQSALVQIQIDGTLTEKFASNAGVRQGCPLSPLLFCLYIQDFQQRVESDKTTAPYILRSGTRVPCLMFADEVSKRGMQRQLDILAQYCKEKHLRINMGKTKAVSFACPQARAEGWGHFTLDGQQIEQDSSYMYLGLLMTATPTYPNAAVDNASRATSASWASAAGLTDKQVSNTRAVIRVWDACVMSRLSYGIEVWGASASKHKWEHIEGILVHFFRNHLHIRQSVCTANLLAELGRYPLEVVAMARTLRYVKKLLKRREETIPVQALQEAAHTAMRHNKGWLAEMVRWFRRWGLTGDIFATKEDVLRQMYLSKRWGADKVSSDQQFYAQNMRIQKDYVREAYLDDSMPPRLKAVLVRFRLRSHRLGIIRSRWAGDVGEAQCTRCTEEEEMDDEGHMLFRCAALNEVKKHFPQLFEESRTLPEFIREADPLTLARFLLMIAWNSASQ